MGAMDEVKEAAEYRYRTVVSIVADMLIEYMNKTPEENRDKTGNGHQEDLESHAAAIDKAAA
jgi:hypothetical protein